MGDHPIIPLSEAIKNKLDGGIIAGVATGVVGWIDWPKVAAIFATFYTILRMWETKTVQGWAKTVRGWFKRK